MFRHFAQTRGTTYVHDYPSIFQKVVSRAWRKLDKKEPKCVMVYKELILENGQVVEVSLSLFSSFHPRFFVFIAIIANF